MLPRRLSWDPSGPAPYESAWSLITKVGAANLLNAHEIASLVITRRPSDSWERLLLSSESWQLNALAALLGVDVERVRTAFLNELGFPSSRQTSYQIRHCPSCAALGYHCTLFNLPLVKRCPWHSLPLSPGCAGCIKLLKTVLASKDRISCNETGSLCHLKINACAVHLVNRVDSILAKEIEQRCFDVVTWWRLLGSQSGDRRSLVAPLMTNREENPFYMRSWRLGWIGDLMPFPNGWGVEERQTPSTVLAAVALDHNEMESVSFTQQASIQGDAYRIVRRVVFNRFLRCHRQCLRELSKMGKFERLALDSRHTCTASVAYLSWRVAHEAHYRLGHPENAANGEKSVRPVRMGEFWPKDLRGAVRLMYANFLRIWSCIEELNSASGIRLLLAGRSSSCDVPFCTYTESDGSCVSLLVPTTESLVRLAQARCKARRQSGMLVYSPGAAYAASGWNAIPDDNLLFSIAHREGLFRNSYQYIEV